MRKAAVALALGGLAAVAAGILAGRAAWLPEPAVEAPVVVIAAPLAQRSPPAEAAPSGKVRPVAPEVVAIPPVDPQALVRVGPREPLSPFGRPLPPPKVDNSRIRRPVADAAGRILGQGLLVDIAGVDTVEPEESCTDPDGIEWPCGMRARTAFRGLLRGRAVVCDVPPGYEGDEITTSCKLGAMDLGAWLVANGWGRAQAGGPYAKEEKAARQAGKGIFGSSPEPLLLAPLPDFMNGG